MSARITRTALTLALLLNVVVPGAVLAADPTAPPADVVEWQQHLEDMRSMGPNLGAHVADCVASHGSVAGLFGPNGAMVQGHGMGSR
ncbi:MAG TPA: hypothetical protein VLA23_12815 [Candidatus Limnocylindrales bacterium]|nr:hypothetical protein [Candidatus Limnocylindrales bacterium]